MNTLVVVTDSPLIWRSSSSSAAAASDADHRHQEVTLRATEREGGGSQNDQDGGGAGKASQRDNERTNKRRSPFSFDSPWRSRNPPPSWSAHPREAASLLSLLFSWASSGGNDDSDECAGDQANPTIAGVAASVAVQDTGPDSAHGSTAHGPTASSSQFCAPKEAASEGGKLGRSFSIVCPATRVRMNIETYVKDSDTGRVAVQWCLASKETGENGCSAKALRRMRSLKIWLGSGSCARKRWSPRIHAPRCALYFNMYPPSRSWHSHPQATRPIFLCQGV